MTYKQRYESACCYALSLTAEYNKLLEENRQLRFLLTGDAAEYFKSKGFLPIIGCDLAK